MQTVSNVGLTSRADHTWWPEAVEEQHVVSQMRDALRYWATHWHGVEEGCSNQAECLQCATVGELCEQYAALHKDWATREVGRTKQPCLSG